MAWAALPRGRGRGGEFDGAHDVVVLAYRLGSEAGPAALGAMAFVVAALAGWGVARWRPALASLARRVTAEPSYAMFALFVGFLASRSSSISMSGTSAVSV